MSDESKSTAGANTMWGGRFAAGPDAIMEAINASMVDTYLRLANARKKQDGPQAG